MQNTAFIQHNVRRSVLRIARVWAMGLKTCQDTMQCETLPWSDLSQLRQKNRVPTRLAKPNSLTLHKNCPVRRSKTLIGQYRVASIIWSTEYS